MAARNLTLELIRNYKPSTDTDTTSFPAARSSRVEGIEHRMADVRAAQGRKVTVPTVEIKGWTVRQGPSDLSEKQAKWIIDIATTREGVTAEMTESVRVRLEQGFAKFAASQFISNYKDLPRREAAPVATPAPAAQATEEVPAGRYAVEIDGELRFYHVDLGKEGTRWAGFVFIDRKSSDDLFPIKSRDSKRQILDAIRAAGVEAASIKYAVTLKQCRRCHRDLTDQSNPYLAMGLGPDCGAKN